MPNEPIRASWRNPYWGTLKGPLAPLRAVFESLSNFMARPDFVNGINLGDGTPGAGSDPAIDPVPTVLVTSETITGITTDLSDVYSTLATMDADITALETDPIDGTRITDDSIDTPQLRANSITALQLAAMSIGVGKWIASTSYTAGVDGWIIEADGSAEFNDIIVRGDIYASLFATGGTGEARVVMDTDKDRIKFYDDADVVQGYITGVDGKVTIHPTNFINLDGETVVSSDILNMQGTAPAFYINDAYLMDYQGVYFSPAASAGEFAYLTAGPTQTQMAIGFSDPGELISAVWAQAYDDNAWLKVGVDADGAPGIMTDWAELYAFDGSAIVQLFTPDYAAYLNVTDSWASLVLADLSASRSHELDITKGLILSEQPSTPSGGANVGVIYTIDNGSGKTQLCVRFNTGAVQVLATEP